MKNLVLFVAICSFSILLAFSCKQEEALNDCERLQYGKIIMNHFDPACLGKVYYLVDHKTEKQGFCNDFAVELDSIDVGTRIVEVQNGSRNQIFIDTIEVEVCNNIVVNW